jgi:hypothetical protein
MKTKMAILAMFLMLIVGLSAQSLNEEINKEIQKELQEAMKEKDEALKSIRITLDKNLDENTSDSFMGIYLADMCFKDAYDMRYKYNYGVLVKGVSAGGPAQAAGLMKGDIIMEFAGEKAYHDSYLSQLIKMQSVGKKTLVKFYRYDKILETEVTIGSRKEYSKKETSEGKEGIQSQGSKTKHSVGHGGGSWIPVWYQPDVEEINVFLKDLGFQSETFSENGFLMQGGGGKGNVGKGWFIGGMGAGYKNEETTKHAWAHYKEGILDTTIVSRTAKYDVSFGGVTLDKRMALSKNLITSLGFMLGAGNSGFKITQKDSNQLLENFDFVTNPSEQMDDTYQYVSTLKMRKDYMIFQPKIMAMYRILGWLAFRAEVGYMTSYSSKGWKIERNGESVKGENIPSADMNGLTFSIGPWFGF